MPKHTLFCSEIVTLSDGYLAGCYAKLKTRACDDLNGDRKIL